MEDLYKTMDIIETKYLHLNRESDKRIRVYLSKSKAHIRFFYSSALESYCILNSVNYEVITAD